MVRNIWFIYPAEHIFNLVSPNFTIKSLFPKVTAPDILVAFKSVFIRISYKCKWWFFVAICCMWYECPSIQPCFDSLIFGLVDSASR